MQAVSNTGRSGVLVLKVDEDDVNTVLMNTDIENDGSLKYAYDNFADAFSENILEYAFAYADIPRNQITKNREKLRRVYLSYMRLKNLDIILNTMCRKKIGNQHFYGGTRKREYWEKLYYTCF